MKVLYAIILFFLIQNAYAQKYYMGIWEIDSKCKLINKIETQSDTLDITEISKLRLPSKNYAVFKSSLDFNEDTLSIFLNKLEKYFDDSKNLYSIIVDIDSIRPFCINLSLVTNGNLFLISNLGNKIEIKNELPIIDHTLTGLCKSYLSFDTIEHRIFANFSNNKFDGTTTYFYNSRISSVYLYEKDRLIYKILFDENCTKTAEFFNGRFYHYDKKGNIIKKK